jgi:DNA polymerase-3 subunit delta'
VTALFGHDAAVAAFRAALDSGRLHHAWLIAGPEGVGKGTFARAASMRLLADAAGPPVQAPGLAVEPDHPTARLFESGGHPDWRLVEREVWDRKGENIIPRHERTGSEDLARGIKIRQIRMLDPFLMVRPTMSRARAIVIDTVDDFEPGAANALLKVLEEPPADTIFLLVSHAPERLLPTIRSRCRLLRLGKLGDDAMASALRTALPDAEEAEIASLVAVGEGAPGRAVAWRGLDIAALDRELLAIAREGDPINARRSALAQELSAKAAQPRYEAFLARVPSLIAAEARARSGPALAEALALWERAGALAGAARRLSFDPQSTAFELAGMLAALAPDGGRRAA